MLEAIATALGELTGSGVIKAALVDASKAELNWATPPVAIPKTAVGDQNTSTTCLAPNVNRAWAFFDNNSNSAANLCPNQCRRGGNCHDRHQDGAARQVLCAALHVDRAIHLHSGTPMPAA